MVVRSNREVGGGVPGPVAVVVGVVCSLVALVASLWISFFVEVDCSGGFIDVDPGSVPAPDSLAGRLCSIRGLALLLVAAISAAPLVGGVRAARKQSWRSFARGMLASLALLVVLSCLQLLTSGGTGSSPFAISIALLALGAGIVGLLSVGAPRRRAIGWAAAVAGGVAFLLFVSGLGGLYALLAMAVSALLLAIRYADSRLRGV